MGKGRSDRRIRFPEQLRRTFGRYPRSSDGRFSAPFAESADEVSGYEWYDSGIGFAVPADHIQKILLV